MNAAERAAELRTQADNLETLGELETAAEAATEKYRSNPTAKNKAAYRKAVEALRETRAIARPADTTITTGEEA